MEEKPIEEQTFSDVSCPKRTTRFLGNSWKGIIVVLTPIILSPLCFYDKRYKCAFVILLMSVFWIVEALPLYVTAMFPIVFLPLFDLLGSEATCQHYFKDTVIMFMGGIMVALAIEFCGLHNRIALGVIRCIGCSPRKLHFGLMLVCAMLSMWISNAATTAMMCPIINAILDELERQGVCKRYDEDDEEKLQEGEKRRPSKISMALFLGVAYASSIGGCGSLIGTPTNLALKAQFEALFPNSTVRIEFVNFMGYSLPIVIIEILLTYLCLEIWFMGLWRPKSKIAQEVKKGAEYEHLAMNIIKDRFKELGRMSCHEISVAILFTFLVAMFFTKSPEIFQGWASLFEVKVKNAFPTKIAILLLFGLPLTYTFYRFCCGRGPLPPKAIDSLLTWSHLQANMPWGLIFLVGGGFAVASASNKSGMAASMATFLKGFEFLPREIVLLVAIAFSEFATAFSSNVAMANVILPVLGEVSRATKTNPLYLMVPSAIACSMAFHLPVSTPPNAIVAAYGNIKTKHMILAGIGPTLTSILTIFVMSIFWGRLIFPDLDDYPEWAERKD